MVVVLLGWSICRSIYCPCCCSILWWLAVLFSLSLDEVCTYFSYSFSLSGLFQSLFSGLFHTIFYAVNLFEGTWILLLWSIYMLGSTSLKFCFALIYKHYKFSFVCRSPKRKWIFEFHSAPLAENFKCTSSKLDKCFLQKFVGNICFDYHEMKDGILMVPICQNVYWNY